MEHAPAHGKGTLKLAVDRGSPVGRLAAALALLLALASTAVAGTARANDDAKPSPRAQPAPASAPAPAPQPAPVPAPMPAPPGGVVFRLPVVEIVGAKPENLELVPGAAMLI